MPPSISPFTQPETRQTALVPSTSAKQRVHLEVKSLPKCPQKMNAEARVCIESMDVIHRWRVHLRSLVTASATRSNFSYDVAQKSNDLTIRTAEKCVLSWKSALGCDHS